MRGLGRERAKIGLGALPGGGPVSEPASNDDSDQLGAVEGVAAGVAASVLLWAVIIFAARQFGF